MSKASEHLDRNHHRRRVNELTTVEHRIHGFCHWFDREVPELAYDDAGELLLDDGIVDWCMVQGASIDWIVCGESLVWRTFAPDKNCVDSLGRSAVYQAAKSGRTKTYLGSRSATVGELRGYRNKNGHGVKVFHAPDEGIHHAHITYDRNPNSVFTKNDKSELKYKLKELFVVDR